MSIDTRAWNIAAGLCLATGCGSRTIGVDTDAGTEATDGSESNTNTTSTIEPPECVNASDCPDGYYCYDGMCEYVPHHDGHLDHTESYTYDECFSDIDCDPLTLCDWNYCSWIPSPDACPAPNPAQPLPIPGVAVALAFVDVDDDGADELVVVTQTELHTYESGSDTPTTSAREAESLAIHGMVGGPFDMAPGEDLVLLFDDMLALYGSDGVGGFSSPSVGPSPWPDGEGLQTGEFDGDALADLLIWGGSGATVQFGSGQTIMLLDQSIADASGRSVTDPVAGFVLALDGEPTLSFHQSSGAEIKQSSMRGEPPFAVTSFVDLGDGYDLSASTITPNGFFGWTIMEEWGPATGNQGTMWGVMGTVSDMAAGDVDGDQHADIALLIDGAPAIRMEVHDDGCLLSYPPHDSPAVQLAIGDHDGDGDDELAVRTMLGEVLLIDGE